MSSEASPGADTADWIIDVISGASAVAGIYTNSGTAAIYSNYTEAGTPSVGFGSLASGTYDVLSYVGQAAQFTKSNPMPSAAGSGTSAGYFNWYLYYPEYWFSLSGQYVSGLSVGAGTSTSFNENWEWNSLDYNPPTSYSANWYDVNLVLN